MENHYDWLEENFATFLNNLGIKNTDWYMGLISAHGDKCYTFKELWASHNIPFNHGVAIYLLSHMRPYSNETRETDHGFVYVDKWVVDNYDRFKQYLPKE